MANHAVNEPSKVDLASPTKDTLSFRGIPKKYVHFSRPHISWILLDVGAPIGYPDLSESKCQEFFDGVRFPRCKNEIVWLIVLEHLPHTAHVIAGVTPVAFRP